MNWDPKLPFNQLPLLPPNVDFETKAILKACIKARATLAELNQLAHFLPNQNLLINLLPLLEAKGSSEIENIVTTTDKLFQFSNDEKNADPITKEALQYRTALRIGFDAIKQRPLNAATAIEVCQVLKGAQIDIRKTTGTMLKNQLTGEVIYTPPVSQHEIKNLLSNWSEFIHQDDDVDPLIKMAILHYQFEAIHPFLDGNGRTGRIMNILFLIEKQLLSLPILYLSRFILEHRSRYYALLLDVTQNQNWEAWILFMLQAIYETSLWTNKKIEMIKALMEETGQKIKTENPKLYSYELIQVIFEQPYCRIQNLIEKNVAKRQTASSYLKELVKMEILTEASIGKEKLFINQRLLELMNAET